MAESYLPHRQQLLRGLTFDQLLMTRTIAESGSFREASRILCLTQPAVSQRVQHVEQVLGTPIFQRHAGVGVSLTGAGRIFMEFCDRAIAELDHLLDDLALSERDGTDSSLAVAAPSDSIQYFMLRVLPMYKARYPERSIHVVQSGSRADSVDAIEAAQADLAFYRVPVDSRLETIALMNERLFLVAASDHPILEQDVEARPAALSRYEFATYSSGMRSRQLVERWALKLGVRMDIGVESKSLEVMKEVALRGTALCVLPGMAISQEVEDGRLTVVEIAGMPLPRSTAIAVRRGAAQSPAMRDFLEILMQYCREKNGPLDPEIRWSFGGSPTGGSAEDSGD
nr:LysR family transcriptional regulator [Microbacterium bovistercoris]